MKITIVGALLLIAAVLAAIFAFRAFAENGARKDESSSGGPALP